MTMPGGLPPPRPDQGFTPAGSPMAPGSSNVVRARQVIVSGPVGAATGVFVYAAGATPGPGNLITSVTNSDGTDAYGNNYLQGTASYDDANGIATQVDSGAMAMYTGSLAGGWTLKAQIFISPGGTIELITSSGVITANNTLDNGAGNMTVNGHLTLAFPLNVAGSSATAGLTNGTINGTSGGASAGTAHTHGPGSYAVANGQHSHGPGSYQAS